MHKARVCLTQFFLLVLQKSTEGEYLLLQKSILLQSTFMVTVGPPLSQTTIC